MDVRRIVNFVKYNNAFAIGVSLAFAGFSVSLAASPELRGNFVSTEEIARSVDNSFILAADLGNLDFDLQIQAVKEDEESYYVLYSYRTIALLDYAWQETVNEKTLQVSKKALANHYLRDLGLYVAKQLGDMAASELAYLGRVKELEKGNGKSSKVVATVYAGLIGKYLDPKERKFPDYAPVIPPEEGGGGVPGTSRASAVTSAAAPTQFDEEEIRRIVKELLAEREQEESDAAAESASTSTTTAASASAASGGGESSPPAEKPAPAPEPVPEPTASSTDPISPPPTGPVATSTPPAEEPEAEPVATSTPPAEEPGAEPVATSTPPAEEPVPAEEPAPQPEQSPEETAPASTETETPAP